MYLVEPFIRSMKIPVVNCAQVAVWRGRALYNNARPTHAHGARDRAASRGTMNPRTARRAVRVPSSTRARRAASVAGTRARVLAEQLVALVCAGTFTSARTEN